MKKTNIIAMALAGLMALPVMAADSKPQAGDILQGINMFTPEEGDPAYKVKANELYGTQWAVDMAYGYWGTDDANPGTNNHNNLFLLHAQLNQRLIEDSLNGGTWLRAEFSGSWGLDKRSANNDKIFVNGFNSASGLHADVYGPHDGVIPELALMHYFAGKRACIIAGMVNLTNYFDAVSIANDTFASFTNDGFVNSTILPLYDSNLGGVLQVELNSSNYIMLGISRSGAEYGDNPFDSDSINGYAVVAEYGHLFADGAGTLRINPFFTQTDEDVDGTGERSRRNAGLVASVEYSPCDTLTVYTRAGFAARQYLSNSAEFSVGANVKVLPSREDDFLGVSYGVFKGRNSLAEPTENEREQVLELMYSLQINDYFKIVPHWQFIMDPAYADKNNESIWGVQTVFSF
ncbi:MAG: carbohydrate porin [Akkermansia sp.]|nr:carbohydrate porin [Akkermansia sp.]